MMYLCLLSCLAAAEPAHVSTIPPGSVVFCVRNGRIVVCKNGGPTLIRKAKSSTGVNPFAPTELAAADGPKQPLRNVSVQAPGVSVRVQSADPAYYGYGTVTTGYTSYYGSSASYESGARKHRVRGLLKRIFRR